MEEIKKEERNDEDVGIKHTVELDIRQIVDSIEGRRQKAEGRVPGEQPCTIYQVSNVLCQVNEKCYEPRLASIGPYHRGKKELKPMEEKKSQYLLALLSRNRMLKLEKIVKKIKKLEARARKCYSESISLESNEFVEMMVLDGCFLVEVFLRVQITRLNDEPWLTRFTTNDMLLLENQIPFFVLESIFSLVAPLKTAELLKELMWCSFGVLPLNPCAVAKESYHHVLDMFHHHCLPTPSADVNVKVDADPHMQVAAFLKANAEQYNAHANTNLPNTIDEILMHRQMWNSEQQKLAAKFKRLSPEVRRAITDASFSSRSAEELQEAGIEFQRKKAEQTRSFLEIEFDKKGVLKIPYLPFSDNLQTIFQNLIAFEQCYPKAGTFFTGYALFMDQLINTAKDVRILRHAGILEYGLGSDDELARHFNELCRRIHVYIPTAHLYGERWAVNDYCRKRWPTWRAKLMRNYFSSPWAILSVIAAVLLLLLTITQTVFSILPNV